MEFQQKVYSHARRNLIEILVHFFCDIHFITVKSILYRYFRCVSISRTCRVSNIVRFSGLASLDSFCPRPNDYQEVLWRVVKFDNDNQKVLNTFNFWFVSTTLLHISQQIVQHKKIGKKLSCFWFYQ